MYSVRKEKALHLPDTILELQNGGSTPKLVSRNDRALSLVYITCKGSSGWLVDDKENLQINNLTSILSYLMPSVVKVGRNSDVGMLVVSR